MRRLPAIALSIGLLALPLDAFSQTRSVRGGQSQFGGQNTRGTGQMSGGRQSTGGNRASAMSNSGGGASMFGSSSGGMFGGSSSANTSRTGTMGQSSSVNRGQQGGQTNSLTQDTLNLGNMGLPVGQNTFVGRVDSGGFVGDRRAGGMMGGMTNLGGLQGLSGGRGGAGNNVNQAWNSQGEQGKATIRPTLKLGFDVPSATPTVGRPEFSAQFDRITARRPELTGVNYSADEAGRVVLTGSVPNEDAKNLAVALFRLEPGIRDVVDELTVAGAND